MKNEKVANFPGENHNFRGKEKFVFLYFLCNILICSRFQSIQGLFQILMYFSAHSRLFALWKKKEQSKENG